MLRNYLKTALRGMRRHSTQSIINVLGLAVGFVAGFFILLWIQDELKFDRHYPEVDQVHRVMRTSTYGPDQIFTWPAITAKLDAVLDEEYPEIEFAALHTWPQNMSFLRGDITFRETGYHAGPDFFRILKHNFLAGNPETALEAPTNVVLSNTMARKYFPEVYEGSVTDAEGAMSVLGQTITLENRLELAITGVIEDVPAQATFQMDYAIALQEYINRNDWVDDWGNNGLRMLVRLTPGASTAAVSDKIRLIIQEATDSENDVLFLQPFTDIHLRSTYDAGVQTGGRIDILRMLGIVGLFILLIAAINFMNLATARSAQRALEVGIRKTFGGQRSHLAGQFLGESVLTAFVALLVAGVATVALLPGFNALTQKELVLADITLKTWLQFGGIALACGLIAGLYPAVYLSAFSVIGVLRRGERNTGKGANLRRGLVVLQFALSIILIVGSITVYNQINFIRTKNLGLDRKDVFYARLEGPMHTQYASYKAQLESNPAIAGVTATSTHPLSVGSSTSWGVRWEGRDETDDTLFSIIQADHDFIPVMKMELLAGRNFSREYGADSLNLVINEAAAAALPWDDPIGQSITHWGREGTIIGVVRNFHINSLYQEIDPTVIRLDEDAAWLTYVRPAPGQTEEALAAFEEVFKAFNPDFPYEYDFVDAYFERQYTSEIIVGKLSRVFTGLAIFIACLGLFGLASFTAERRTREIGIRKVLGATIPGVVGLLSREFIALTLIAFVLATPVAAWLMQRWLSSFAYHVSLSWTVFGAAMLGVVVITYATVGWQSIRAATANPADSLRSE